MGKRGRPKGSRNGAAATDGAATPTKTHKRTEKFSKEDMLKFGEFVMKGSKSIPIEEEFTLFSEMRSRGVIS